MKNYVLALLFFFIYSHSYADAFGYNKVVTFKKESKNLIVIHHHDWSKETSDARFKMISTDRNPFTIENNYAYVICIDKKSRDTIFNSPSIALTDIIISNNEKHIIGISNIKLRNPFQLVVFDSLGEISYKKHFSSYEAGLSRSQLIEFQETYPKQYGYLDSIQSIYSVRDSIYIDYSMSGMPKQLGNAWTFLFEHSTSNHLSSNFSESVTNSIYWFSEKNPQLECIYLEGKLVKLSLLDPDEAKYEIIIN